MLKNTSVARTRPRWQILSALAVAFGALFAGTPGRADAQLNCPCSIWPGTAVPGVANDPETGSVEVGVRFRSDVDGFITALRFYKGPLNAGIHTGSLWTNTGTLLGRVTFTNETPSGWQQADLPTPVAITANTIYVASYLAPVGRYSINQNYFTTAVDNPPLHAIANSESPNGRYRYTATSAFPNSTFRSSNYWVDVVFNTTSSDSTPPTVATTSPANAATGVAAGANILATFSEPMNPAGITTTTFELRDQSGVLVPAAVSYNAATMVATLNPTANLPAGLNFTATVRGGPAGVKDAAGNPMAADFVWFFKRGGTDATPPSVTGFTPAAGATGVATSTPVTATFAEAMNPTTITATTFTLTGQEGVVPASVTYDAPTKRAILTANASLLAGVTYVARVVSGGAGVKDLAGLALTADVTWSFTVGGTDTTPPTVASFTPPNGATDVSRATTVTATFSEPMNGSTIDGARFMLAGPGGNQVPASVAYNATTRTATLTPSNQLGGAASYTATVVGGPNGVTDLAGNALAANTTWSFTAAAAPQPPEGCPCTLFAATDTPTVPSDAETVAIEVGVKFSSTFDGSISGIRFYKGPLNTGTHVGRLWTTTGTLLASVTFTNETASGWQQANFATPVAITANTTYVASYQASGGRYSTTENYFTVGVSRGPLQAPANAVTPNGVYVYGPGAFPTNSFAATNYWVDVVYNPTAAPDTTPPTITAVTPPEATSNVSVTTSVTATFSEPMDPATVGPGTVELRGPSNVLVPGAVSYDAIGRVATLTPTSALATATTYVATVRGGSTDPRVKDVAGNALAASFSWSFTTSDTGPPGTCPCTIWTPTTTPAVAGFNDPAAIELGVKFRSDQNGFITGVRFYKAATNTGTHVGKLWSITGVLLGSVTFANETPSGWQQADFATPIQISANTTYVASYHTTVGFYSVDSAYFASTGADRAPLHALSSPAAGGNGVFQYGPGGFPTQSFNATNYSVDVVFNTNVTLPPDTTPPSVTAVKPSPGAGAIAPAVDVIVTFSEAMDPATISTGSIELRGPGNTLVPGSVSYDAVSRSATLNPSGALADSTAYTLTVRGGGTDPRVKDLSGNVLAANFTSSFTTATNTQPPPLGQGPGGPILVITTPQNKFSTYYSEILYAEGLNLFAVADASAITSAGLTGFDVIILGEMPLTPTQVTTLTDWVNSGGNLIAMRPDKQLSPLLGLADTNTTLSEAYLLVDTSAPPGQGIVGQTMQFHGTADRYTLDGATAVATLFSSPTAATTHPAVTLRSIGTLGGHAAAFTYDLAKSVVYTRQGNLAWETEERDGFSPIRSDDLFFGAASSDPQPDWVNLNKVAIPQADEQQRLLANLIGVMTSTRRPLPRFWYLPRGLKAVVVMTGDDHANGGTAGRFEQYLSISPPGCNVDQWECVRGTSYIYVSSAMTDTLAARYHALGFEIGLHVLTGCADWTPSSLASFYTDQLAEFRAAYPSIPAPTTNRTHCIVWSDWSTQAQVEFNNNIGLDTNYYYWPQSWVASQAGFFTGSGMPMRFAALDGTLIDVYQATSQMTDESGQPFPATVNTLLDRALGPEGYYGVFTANMHTDFVDSPGSDAIVASAQARGVPIVAARQMLEWLDGRNGSSFTSLTWNGVALGFSIDVAIGANGLQAMVPAQFAGRVLTGLSLDGASVNVTLRTIKGVQWATFAAAPGTYQATYASP
jgi:hypothetical protein